MNDPYLDFTRLLGVVHVVKSLFYRFSHSQHAVVRQHHNLRRDGKTTDTHQNATLNNLHTLIVR